MVDDELPQWMIDMSNQIRKDIDAEIIKHCIALGNNSKCDCLSCRIKEDEKRFQ